MEKIPHPAKSINFSHRSLSNKASLLNKSSSFALHLDRPILPPSLTTLSSVNAVCNSDQQNGDVDDHPPNLLQVSEDIDGLILQLSSIDDVSDIPEIPPSVEKFPEMVQSEIDKYDAHGSPLKFGDDTHQETLFIDALTRLSMLSNLLTKFSSCHKVRPFLSLSTLVIQHAMTFMEEELRMLLEDAKNLPCLSISKTLKATDSEDRQNQLQEEEGNNYPGISEKTIGNLRKIAVVMVTGGYETECCHVYSILRRNAFKEAMKQLGFEKISMDDVQKMQWESLEGHIGIWIKVVKYASKVLLPAEKTLCDFIFSDEQHRSIRDSMFSNLIRSTVILFLNFAEAITMTKRSAERLFKVLDMYETLTDLMFAIDGFCPLECANELTAEVFSVRRRLGEAGVSMFSDLENSIKNDVANKNPVSGGAVHPLTRYTMNYLRYACDFKDTLEEVFSLHHTTTRHLEALEPRREKLDQDESSNSNEEAGASKETPFAGELMNIMDLLDSNLEGKSKLYKDPSLWFIFSMNNGRYILQKIKESTEMHELVGNTYCRKRSSELRGYHKSYQRETWSRVLQCLNQEGMQVNGKVQKHVLKERFKSFNQMFDDISKTQTSWVVSDKQLQSELRVSISSVMIPAYRSFLGRFGQIFSPGKQSDKYIRYQPEDIESTIEGLFDGNQNLSMARRKN